MALVPQRGESPPTPLYTRRLSPHLQRQTTSLPPCSDTTVARARSNVQYVSRSEHWNEFLDVFSMLWDGDRRMTLNQLKSTMEEVYGFWATIDQHKKKFKEWYKKGVLKPKYRKRRNSQDIKMIEQEYPLTPASTPDTVASPFTEEESAIPSALAPIRPVAHSTTQSSRPGDASRLPPPRSLSTPHQN
ncbi:hypothetical protein BU26DRAFT_313495 [Trematosphaeria pertusa]|uniref:Clr5 domain-containing protein n=1 Tax=Trematosphaeria pertusa TaxID=390896 RepID=A0A6A6IFJ0_9PLEO|nr:uncharacterized protein BU26DRAFT_313495 [Trematosphaeria pertusa]KAF2249176.1 hypothetical protein BU26DRAFT_313495 [Trematosphaeria pertusa]